MIHCESECHGAERHLSVHIVEKALPYASTAKLWKDKQFIYKQQRPAELVAPVGNQKGIAPQFATFEK